MNRNPLLFLPLALLFRDPVTNWIYLKSENIRKEKLITYLSSISPLLYLIAHIIRSGSSIRNFPQLVRVYVSVYINIKYVWMCVLLTAARQLRLPVIICVCASSF